MDKTEIENVISIRNLSRQFGNTLALNNISLNIPRGSVFGLVGVNGAGKTTLIKHLIGLLKAKQGEVEVFGKDPVKNPVEVLSRIGYLAEDNELPEWMKVEEILNYTQAFYPGWDHQYANELVKSFDLDPTKKIKNLSKGQKSRTGLILAIAYKPEILILDEPSSGLDPIVRSDILKAVIQTVSNEGRTVVFSSHLLDEVERVSDHITMINQGNVVISSQLEVLKKEFHRLTIRFEKEQSNRPDLVKNVFWQGQGCEWTAVCNGQFDHIKQEISGAGAVIVDQSIPSLNEIFVSQVHNKSTVV